MLMPECELWYYAVNTGSDAVVYKWRGKSGE